MRLSSTSQQAIQAVLVIGAAGNTPVRVDDIASALGHPRNYLSKTLHILARDGVLRSVRGPGGGFLLAVPPERLTLAKVVARFESVGQRRCLLGRATCTDRHACAVHERWRDASNSVDDFFRTTTIAGLLAEPADTSR